MKKRDNDEVMYYSLYKDNDEINCESNSTFGDLKNNTIMDTFVNLYKEEVERAMKKWFK